MEQDVAASWILGDFEDGYSFPRPSISSSITIPEGSFANFLVLDIDACSEQYEIKTGT